MKILSTEQIRQGDQYTILNEYINSVDLMERAANQVFEWIIKRIDPAKEVLFFCGMGNNGGDGLAVARMLYKQNIVPQVYQVHHSEKMSPDCEANYQRLTDETNVAIHEIRSNEDFPEIPHGSILIDAMFGSGLNRPIEGMTADLIEYLNQQDAIRIAIDIASGLFADAPSPSRAIIHADYTLTFQTPKLAFFMPENDTFVGRWEVLDIRIHPQFLLEIDTNNLLFESDIAKGIIHKRPKYSHKGTYGHALLIAGSEGMTGAAILSAKSCLRSGVGLLSVCLPPSAQMPLQVSLPEAMMHDAEHLAPFNAIGIGPGLSRSEEAVRTVRRIIQECHVPLVMDADALNILSENKTWLSFLPAKTILTPHPKEFERLFGATDNGFARLELQRKMAMEHNIIIVVKGANTATAMPNGAVFFNSTGNPGMATAGSGDVLTGMILSLLAQRYTPEEAAVLGVYLHGLAGDLAAEELGQEALIASDIINNIGRAFTSMRT